MKFFKDAEQYKDDLQVIWNDKLWVIKRGIPVMIPRGLVLALDDAEKQNMKAIALMEGMEEAYTKSMSRLN